MIPIIKNILVIDENNNSLVPTYTRRAKHLVKKGRAHWLNENAIKLIFNDTHYKEEKYMSENNTDVFDINSIKEFIEKVANENSVAEKAIEEISKFSNEDLKAARITEVVKSHESAKVSILTELIEKLSK